MENNQYYQSRHFLRLLHRYEKAVAEGHVPYFEADELTDIAEYYMTGQQDAKANQAIQAAIDMHPGSVDPQIFLARQNMFYGKLDEARAILDAITEQEDSEVIYLRAELLIKEGRAGDASAFLLGNLELMQDILADYLYDCISIFMDYDKWELANEWMNRLKRSFPIHPKLPIMEAEIRMGLDDYANALPLLQTIVGDEPYNSDAWNLLAETYEALERYEEAMEAAEYSLAINPEDTDAMLVKAHCHMRNDEMEAAIEFFRHYIDVKPDDIAAMLSLIICYSAVSNFQDILPLSEIAERHALELPNNEAKLSQIYQLRALALCFCDRTPEAIATIEKAKEYCEESELWCLDMCMGDILLHNEQQKMAEEYYIKAMEATPDQAHTLFHIAMSYNSADQLDIAISLLTNVWSMLGTKKGKFVVPYIAQCYLRKNDQKEFLEYLKLAPYCDREATKKLFQDQFPNMPPEDYYAYAYHKIYGVFPPNPLQNE